MACTCCKVQGDRPEIAVFKSLTWRPPPGKEIKPNHKWDIIDLIIDYPRFFVQAVNETTYSYCYNSIFKHLMEGNQFCKKLGFPEDRYSMHGVIQNIKFVLKNKISTVCIANTRESNKLVGVDLMVVRSNKDREINIDNQEGVAMRNLLTIIKTLENTVNIFEMYTVNNYIVSYGISIAPEFRRMSLSAGMIDVRERICRHYEISLVVAICLTKRLQTLHQQAGYTEITSVPYYNFHLKGIDLTNCDCGFAKIMVKQYNLNERASYDIMDNIAAKRDAIMSNLASVATKSGIPSKSRVLSSDKIAVGEPSVSYMPKTDDGCTSSGSHASDNITDNLDKLLNMPSTSGLPSNSRVLSSHELTIHEPSASATPAKPTSTPAPIVKSLQFCKESLDSIEPMSLSEKSQSTSSGEKNTAEMAEQSPELPSLESDSPEELPPMEGSPANNPKKEGENTEL